MELRDDTYWMKRAISLARTSAKIDEVPVGAIIVLDNEIISTGINTRESSKKATAHAEIMAIEKANKILGNWRLLDATLYVTLEPCIMCAGAIYQSRVKRVVYGTPDPKGGATGSLYSINADERLNHTFEVSSGVLGDECAKLLKDFFKAKRAK